MSLNWSATKVADWENLSQENWERIETVIFDTMGAGINQITEANWEEFYRRELMVRAALGYSLKEFQEFMPRDFIHKLVGLGTNASSLTVTQFNKSLVSMMERRVYSYAHPD